MLLGCGARMNAAAEPNPAPALLVTAVRTWEAGGVSRIAIELSGEAKYVCDRIDKPERLFLDIRDARMKLGEKGFFSLKVGDGRVSRVRIAQKETRLVRVVLDLEQAGLEYEVSQLVNPARIVIELRRKKKAELMAPAADQPAAPAEPPQVVARSRKESAKAASPLPGVKTAGADAMAQAEGAGPGAKTEEGEPAAKKEPPAMAAPEPARRLSNGQRSMTRVLGLKLGKIVIDPGHGGHDQGTSGSTGLLEKELVLDVSRRLGALVAERLGSEVILTREDDTYVALEERTAIANRHRADLFLSIHANSSPYKSISGAETYFLNFTTVKVDLEVASRENAPANKSIFELGELVKKIALKDKLDESREFAMRVQSSLAGAWVTANDTSHNRGVKKAPFVVLIGASMPSVLAEIGFVTNPHDEVLLKKTEFRQKIAEALYQGVAKYAATLSKMDVAQRAQP